MVDLTARPFNLDDDGVRWVQQTIAGMTDEEKIGQLFVNMGSSRNEEYLKAMVDDYHIAAVRYQPGPASEIWEQNRILQENSKIPMLIAANTEAGGNGACTDGTYVGWEIKVAATQDPKYAYELGRISGIEAAAIGCNWSFAPIVDLYRNWRNPIVSVRTWSADPDQTIEFTEQYLRGIMESGIAPAAKHWPGDGIDERDQHLSSAPNWLSCAEWDATFGKVYSALIEAGLPSIMAGHIALPSYQKHFNPTMTDEDILPATLSKEITTDLLRGQLGFNGVVVTDASHMVALTGAMKRSELLPTAIMAGCDLFLFFNDPDEDFAWMMDAYRDGRLTHERLTEALTRTLGLKASLGPAQEGKDRDPAAQGRSPGQDRPARTRGRRGGDLRQGGDPGQVEGGRCPADLTGEVQARPGRPDLRTEEPDGPQQGRRTAPSASARNSAGAGTRSRSTSR